MNTPIRVAKDEVVREHLVRELRNEFAGDLNFNLSDFTFRKRFKLKTTAAEERYHMLMLKYGLLPVELTQAEQNLIVRARIKEEKEALRALKEEEARRATATAPNHRRAA